MATTHVATLGTHWVPTHTNTRKHRHTQTAPRRTRARYDENLGNGVGDPSTEEGRLVLGTRERQLTGNLPPTPPLWLYIAWKENSAKTLTNKDLSPLAVWLRAAEH